MTINGVSTCTKAGTEKYEKFQTGIGRRKRDKWLTAKERKEDKR